MIPLALILREPDLGTSLVYAAIWLGLIFWFGISWSILLGAASPLLSALLSFYSERIANSPWPWGIYLLVLLLVLYLAKSGIRESFLLLLANIGGGVGMTFFWEGLKPYQQDRILSFFNPEDEKYKLATGYQPSSPRSPSAAADSWAPSTFTEPRRACRFYRKDTRTSSIRCWARRWDSWAPWDCSWSSP